MNGSVQFHTFFIVEILWFLCQTTKDLKNGEIRGRINSDPILKSLNLDFGVDFNRLLAFHGDIEIGDLAFDDFAKNLKDKRFLINCLDHDKLV